MRTSALARQAEHVLQTNGWVVSEPSRKVHSALLWTCGTLTDRPKADSVHALGGHAVVCSGPRREGEAADLAISRAHNGDTLSMHGLSHSTNLVEGTCGCSNLGSAAAARGVQRDSTQRQTEDSEQLERCREDLRCMKCIEVNDGYARH